MPGTFLRLVQVGEVMVHESLELILEPFQYAFMVRAFVGVGLIAVVAAVIGTFVVLKGLAFMGTPLPIPPLPALPWVCSWVLGFT